jgi:hypothetical protein
VTQHTTVTASITTMSTAHPPTHSPAHKKGSTHRFVAALVLLRAALVGQLLGGAEGSPAFADTLVPLVVAYALPSAVQHTQCYQHGWNAAKAAGEISNSEHIAQNTSHRGSCSGVIRDRHATHS